MSGAFLKNDTFLKDVEEQCRIATKKISDDKQLSDLEKFVSSIDDSRIKLFQMVRTLPMSLRKRKEIRKESEKIACLAMMVYNETIRIGIGDD